MKRNRILALTLGIVLLTSACGSGNDSEAQAKKPPGDPIILGVIGSFSGGMSGSIGRAADGSTIWATSVNDAGGINGHPVEMRIKDDAGDPAKALQAVKELIEQDHVMAIVSNQSLVSGSWAEYASSKGVPVIGGTPIEPLFSSDPNFYPIGTGVVPLIFGQLVRMKAEGLSKMGLLYCAEAPVCAQLDGLAKALAGVVGGVQVVAATKVSATQPSYNAECLSMQAAGADALFVASVAPAVIAVTAGCAKVGYDPVDVNQATTVSDGWFTTPSLDGALLAGPMPPMTDASVPGIEEFTDAVEKWQPDLLKSPQFTPNVLYAWLSGKMFEKVAKLANLSPTSTSADVKNGLDMVKDETLDGAAPPLTYVKDRPTLVSCWFNINVEGGELVSQGAKPDCLTPEQLSGVQAILGG